MNATTMERLAECWTSSPGGLKAKAEADREHVAEGESMLSE